MRLIKKNTNKNSLVFLKLSIKFSFQKKKILIFTSTILFFYACLVIYGSFFSNAFVVISSTSRVFPTKNYQSNVEYQNYPVNIPTFRNYYSSAYTPGAIQPNLQNFRVENGETRFLSSDPAPGRDNLFNQYLRKAEADGTNPPEETSSEYAYPCLNYADSSGVHPLPGYNTFNPEAKLNATNIQSKNIEYHYPGFLFNADNNGTHSIYDDFIRSIVNGGSLSQYYDKLNPSSTSTASLFDKISARLTQNINYVASNRMAPNDEDSTSAFDYFISRGYNDFMRIKQDTEHFSTFNDFKKNTLRQQQMNNYLQLSPDADFAPFFTARCSLLFGLLEGMDGNIGGLSLSNVFFQALNNYCRYFKLNSLITNSMAFDFPLAYETDDSSGLPLITKVFAGPGNNKIISGVADIFEQGIIKNLPTFLLSKFYNNKLSLNINLIPFNPSTDCKYTYINGQISEAHSSHSKQNVELWGLPLTPTATNNANITIQNKQGQNLKQLLTFHNSSDGSEMSPFKVVVNNTFVHKYHLGVGSEFTLTHNKKVNTVHTWNKYSGNDESSEPAKLNNFLSFNNSDTSTSESGKFTVGTSTNGLFYRLPPHSNPIHNKHNWPQFDSLSFLYKNYQNMNSLGAEGVKKFLDDPKIQLKNTFGMHIDNVKDEKKIKIVGIDNNDYYQPIMITNKQRVDLMNWGSDDQGGQQHQDWNSIAKSGELFNGKLTKKGSPDDLNNFSIFNDKSDYTPIGLNGNGKIWDSKTNKFKTAKIIPFTFSSWGLGAPSYYQNIAKNYSKPFLADPKYSDEYKEINYMNNIKKEANQKYQNFTIFKGNSESSVKSMFSHDLFVTSIQNSARLASAAMALMFMIMFLLVLLILAVVLRKIIENNKHVIAVLKASGYHNFQILKLLFAPFFICGFIAFSTSYLVSILTTKYIFTSLFSALNVPPIFSGSSYEFGIVALLLLWLLGAILVLVVFQNIKKIKAKI